MSPISHRNFAVVRLNICKRSW